jgi:toxin ParE1/3/4
MKSLVYQLSEIAGKDLEDIFDYTHQKFGLNQAILYVLSFDEVFTLISKNPKLGINRNEIKNGLKSFVYKSRIIFYRIITNKIRIVRVLHGSRDLPRHLKSV